MYIPGSFFEEVWKQSPFPGYWVSTHGRVFSEKEWRRLLEPGRILQPMKDRSRPNRTPRYLLFIKRKDMYDLPKKYIKRLERKLRKRFRPGIEEEYSHSSRMQYAHQRITISYPELRRLTFGNVRFVISRDGVD